MNILAHLNDPEYFASSICLISVKRILPCKVIYLKFMGLACRLLCGTVIQPTTVSNKNEPHLPTVVSH